MSGSKLRGLRGPDLHADYDGGMAYLQEVAHGEITTGHEPRPSQCIRVPIPQFRYTSLACTDLPAVATSAGGARYVLDPIELAAQYQRRSNTGDAQELRTLTQFLRDLGPSRGASVGG